MRPLHNSILANIIRFFSMKSMMNVQVFAKIRVMQRSHCINGRVFRLARRSLDKA
jgi:hypothetical protein